MVGPIPNKSMGYYIIIKHKNDMHAPAVLQKLAIGNYQNYNLEYIIYLMDFL